MKFKDFLELQIDEIPGFDDKYKECQFFAELAQKAITTENYRWFFSAFLSAAKACLDIKARLLLEIADCEKGDNAYFSYKINKKGIVSVAAKSELLKKMIEIRNINSHRSSSIVKLVSGASECEVYFVDEFIDANEFMMNVLKELDGIRVI